MAVIPHSIDIVVADMGRALAFYRALGLDAPETRAGDAQVQIETGGGLAIGLLTEAAMRAADPAWVEPVGRRVTVACRCDDAREVDAVYARMTDAGFVGLRAPWDSPWGQRYAFLEDPDGTRVDLFAEAA